MKLLLICTLIYLPTELDGDLNTVRYIVKSEAQCYNQLASPAVPFERDYEVIDYSTWAGRLHFHFLCGENADQCKDMRH